MKEVLEKLKQAALKLLDRLLEEAILTKPMGAMGKQLLFNGSPDVSDLELNPHAACRELRSSYPTWISGSSVLRNLGITTYRVFIEKIMTLLKDLDIEEGLKESLLYGLNKIYEDYRYIRYREFVNKVCEELESFKDVVNPIIKELEEFIKEKTSGNITGDEAINLSYLYLALYLAYKYSKIN